MVDRPPKGRLLEPNSARRKIAWYRQFDWGSSEATLAGTSCDSQARGLPPISGCSGVYVCSESGSGDSSGQLGVFFMPYQIDTSRG